MCFSAILFSVGMCFTIGASAALLTLEEDSYRKSPLSPINEDSIIVSDVEGQLRTIHGVTRAPRIIWDTLDDGTYPQYLSVIKGTTTVSPDVTFKNIKIEVHAKAGLIFEGLHPENDFKVTLYGATLGFDLHKLPEEVQTHSGIIILQAPSQIELISSSAHPVLHFTNTISDVVFCWGKDLSAQCQLSFKGPGTHSTIALSGANYWKKGTVIDQVALEILSENSLPLDNPTVLKEGFLRFKLPKESRYAGTGNISGYGTLVIEEGLVDLYGDLREIDVVAQGGITSFFGEHSNIGKIFLKQEGVLELHSINNIGSGAFYISGGELRILGDITLSKEQTFAIEEKALISIEGGSTFIVPNLSVIAGKGLDKVFALEGEGLAVIEKISFEDVKYSSLHVEGSLKGTSGLRIVDSSNTNTVTLEDLHYFIGNTVVEGGTLNLQEDSSLYTRAYGLVKVLSGANLHGEGLGAMINGCVVNDGAVNGSLSVMGSLTSKGTVYPGDSIGEILTQKAVFSSEATLHIYVDEEGSSLLTVIEDLVIDQGSTLIFDVGTNFIKPGTHSTFLTWGSRSGIFTHIDKPSAWRRAEVSYGENSATVTWVYNSLAKMASSSNGRKIGEVFDRALLLEDPALFTAVEFFTDSTKKEISASLEEMQPALYKAAIILQQNAIIRVQDTLKLRLEGVLDAASCSQDTENPWHIWVNGFGDALSQKKEKDTVGYRGNTAGGVLGVDYHFTTPFYLGALGGYTHSSLHFLEEKGKGHIESSYAGLYASFLGEMFYGTLSFTGGWSHFKERRNLFFPHETLKASNSHGGVELLSHLDTGVNYNLYGWLIRPFDSLDYIIGKENAFREKGAGSFNLLVHKSNFILLRNELGLTLSKCFSIKSSNWLVSPKISWVREIQVKGSTYKVEFRDLDIPFTIEGYLPSRSLVSPGLVLRGSFLEDFLAFNLYYNGEFGRGYKDHSYGGELRLGF